MGYTSGPFLSCILSTPPHATEDRHAMLLLRVDDNAASKGTVGGEKVSCIHVSCHFLCLHNAVFVCFPCTLCDTS